jgi:hypothetical protein
MTKLLTIWSYQTEIERIIFSQSSQQWREDCEKSMHPVKRAQFLHLLHRLHFWMPSIFFLRTRFPLFATIKFQIVALSHIDGINPLGLRAPETKHSNKLLRNANSQFNDFANRCMSPIEQ